MPLRYDYQPIGGSHAQRDVFNFYLIDAAIQSGQLILAKSLLAERVAIHSNSYGSWEKYAHVCAKLGDQKNASFAQSEVSRLSKQLH
jgi:Tfp pilus assembly protein PilF